MKVKTYVFEDVKSGIEMLKKEYSPDAVIVEIKENGKIGSRKNCEIFYKILLEGNVWKARERRQLQ